MILHLFKKLKLFIYLLDFMKHCKGPQNNYLDGALYHKLYITMLLFVGGSSSGGAPIITFSSSSRSSEVSEEEYHNVVTYLTSIPS